MDLLEDVETKAESLQCVLRGQQTGQNYCNNHFSELGKAQTITVVLDQLARKTRPTDFQTTDAGPGDGISETMVHLRMTESLLNDANNNMQIRAHYTPCDSKSHKIEQVK